MAFIAQTIKLPAACGVIKKQESCTMCPMAGAAKSCPFCEQQKPTKENKKPVSKCIDCPLCATMLAAQPAGLKHIVYFTAATYTYCINSNVADYAYPQWKPPNAA